MYQKLLSMLENIRVSNQPSATIRVWEYEMMANWVWDVSGKQHIKVRHGRENKSVESE
jgi:hypothetical protein